MRAAAPALPPVLAPVLLLVSAAPLGAATGQAAIEATTLDGAHVRAGAAGEPVTLVNFWATWCVPCRAEMPALDAYYRANGARGLRVIAISMDDPAAAAKVRAIAGEFHFPVALARDSRIAGAYRPSRLPVTLLFDRKGALAYDSRRGKPSLLDAALLETIAGPLLSQRPGGR